MCIELAFSIRHELQMFKTINEPINNPSDTVKENIDDIEKIEQRLSVMIVSKNLPEIGTETPSISPYELANQVIVGNCTRVEGVKGVKYVMGLYLTPISMNI